MRTLRYLFRLYEGNALATPGLNIVMRGLATKALRLVLYTTWKIHFRDTENDNHIEFSTEYRKLKSADRALELMSATQSWDSVLREFVNKRH